MSVFLRPFGYLGVTVVWFAIFAITVALAFCFWVVPPGELSHQHLTEDLQDPKNLIAGIVLLFGLLPFVWGLVHMLVLMAAGPLLLAALAFARSLRPSYRNERLTGSVLRGDAAGLSPGGMAISLLPRRHTAYSRWATRLNVRAWLLDGSWYLGLAWFGYVQYLLIYAVRWPLHNPFAIGVVVLFAAAFAVLGVRRLRVGWRRLRLVAVDGQLPEVVAGA
ncbi:MAG TPA: hypothetical protein VGC45_14035 [Gryllotalpicola sp.]